DPTQYLARTRRIERRLPGRRERSRSLERRNPIVFEISDDEIESDGIGILVARGRWRSNGHLRSRRFQDRLQRTRPVVIIGDDEYADVTKQEVHRVLIVGQQRLTREPDGERRSLTQTGTRHRDGSIV